MSFEADIRKHGDNYADSNVGGDIDNPHMPGDPDNVKFLDGIVEKFIRYGLKYKYDLFRHYYLSVLLDFEKAENILIENKRSDSRSINFMIGFGVNY